jgi:hypothetical protein
MVEPLETFDADSLTLLEFIMEVESAYDVELNEADVNACRTIGAGRTRGCRKAMRSLYAAIFAL